MRILYLILTDHSGSLSLYTLKLAVNTISGTTKQYITIVPADRDKGMYQQLAYIERYIEAVADLPYAM